MSIIYGTRSKTDVLPSLDLRFSYRKDLIDTISGKNLIDFSRVQSGTSKSTYFGADGLLKYADSNEPRFDHDPTTGESLGLLVEEARTNLLYPSIIPSTSNGVIVVDNAVIQTNAGLSPDGTFTASLVNFDLGTGNNRFYFFTGGVLRDETYSFYIKSASPGSVFAFATVGAMSYIIGYFDFDSETLTGVNTSAITIVNYPNGWYKISFTATILTTSLTSAYIQIRPFTSGTGSFYTWGWQREASSFPTSHIPTLPTFTSRNSTATYYDENGIIQTAAIDVARDDAYLPDENGVMRPAGLLLEAARTNIKTNSQVFTSGWNRSGIDPITQNTSITTPEGLTDGVGVITESSGGTVHQVYSATTVRYTGYYTYSIFVKPNGRNYVVLSKSSFTHNLSDGTTIGSPSGEYISAKTEKFPNGWYRCSLVRLHNNTFDQFNLKLANGPGTTSYSGDGVSGVYIWGAQQEAAAYPTSYIPTAGSTVTRAADVSSSSTVTRSADVAQITGSNFSSWYNQSEGSFFLHERNSYGTTLAIRFELNQDSSPNSNAIAFAVNYGNGIRISSRDSNTTGSIDRSLFNVWTSGGSHKYAYGLEENNFSVVSGTNIGTDTLGTFPPNLDSLSFGGASARAVTLSNTCGKVSISRLTYYPQRLPDTTLQKLTE